MWTKDFWKGASERAVATFLEVYVAVIFLAVGEDAIGVSVGFSDIDWIGAASIAGVATILSLAKSFGNIDFTAGRTKQESTYDYDNYV